MRRQGTSLLNQSDVDIAACVIEAPDASLFNRVDNRRSRWLVVVDHQQRELAEMASDFCHRAVPFKKPDSAPNPLRRLGVVAEDEVRATQRGRAIQNVLVRMVLVPWLLLVTLSK